MCSARPLDRVLKLSFVGIGWFGQTGPKHVPVVSASTVHTCYMWLLLPDQ
jgi:hypothetical protein